MLVQYLRLGHLQANAGTVSQTRPQLPPCTVFPINYSSSFLHSTSLSLHYRQSRYINHKPCFTVLHLAVAVLHYMFRPTWPSSSVQDVFTFIFLKESASLVSLTRFHLCFFVVLFSSLINQKLQASNRSPETKYQAWQYSWVSSDQLENAVTVAPFTQGTIASLQTFPNSECIILPFKVVEATPTIPRLNKSHTTRSRRMCFGMWHRGAV
jgi:hypothetical protein